MRQRQVQSYLKIPSLLGQLNLEDWLVDHTYLYRYRHTLNNLMNLSITRYEEPITNQYGFEPFDIEFPVTVPPDPNDSSFHVQYYFEILCNYSVRPGNRTAIEQILEMQDTETTIILVEMPIPDTYFDFFDTPSTDYSHFINTLRNTALEHDTFIWKQPVSILSRMMAGWIIVMKIVKAPYCLVNGWDSNLVKRLQSAEYADMKSNKNIEN